MVYRYDVIIVLVLRGRIAKVYVVASVVAIDEVGVFTCCVLSQRLFELSHKTPIVTIESKLEQRLLHLLSALVTTTSSVIIVFPESALKRGGVKILFLFLILKLI